jgi:hypothetical protein
MDEVEARGLLDGVMAELRTESYPALVAQYVAETGVRDLIGESGAEYCVEIQGVWDRGKPGDLRILVGIDDGHLRAALSPLTDDFVMAPDGSFVGE